MPRRAFLPPSRGVDPHRPPSRVRLLERVWLYGVHADSPDSVTLSKAAPKGARYCVARGIGAGGGRDGSTATSTGAGGDYARAKFRTPPGSVVVAEAPNRAALDGSDGGAAIVTLGGVVKLRAEGGEGGGASPGAAGPRATSIGDVVRGGAAGTSTTGGASGSDFDDLDTLQLGGATKTFPATAPATDGTEPPRLAVYGAGGAPSGSDGPTAGDGRAGEPGVVVLEFYDGDPG